MSLLLVAGLPALSSPPCDGWAHGQPALAAGFFAVTAALSAQGRWACVLTGCGGDLAEPLG